MKLFIQRIVIGLLLLAAPAQAAWEPFQNYALTGLTGWNDLKIGGGGEIAGIDIQSGNAVAVRTDVYGAYVRNTTGNCFGNIPAPCWQQLVNSSSMPASFQVPLANADGAYEVRIAPSNPSVIYLEFYGYVLVSTNGGQTFTTNFSQVTQSSVASNQGQPTNTANQVKAWAPKLAIDPGNANYAFAGTEQSGIFATTNGGASWAAISTGQIPSAGTFSPSSGSCQSTCQGGYLIAWDPNNNANAYAQSYGNGIYATTNATSGSSSTWSKINGSSGPTTVFYMAITSAGVLWCIDTGNNLWSYSGGGTGGTWTKVLSNPSGHTLSAVAADDPNSSTHIVAVDTNGNIDESTNGTSFGGWSSATAAGATTWQGNNFTQPEAIAFDQVTANKLWLPTQIGVATAPFTSGSVSGATLTWTWQNPGIEELVANQVIVPASGNPMSLSWDFGVFTPNTSTYPTTYYDTAQGLCAGWSGDVQPGTTNVVVLADGGYGGFSDCSAYTTTGGLPMSSLSPPSVNGHGGAIAITKSGSILFAPAGHQPYYASSINGGSPSWTGITVTGSPWPNISYYNNDRWITADLVNTNTFYLMTESNSFWSSSNGGASWSEVNSSAPASFFNGNAWLEAVPGEAGNLFFTIGQSESANQSFYQTVNGGTSFSALSGVGTVNAFGFGAPQTAGNYPAVFIAGWLSSPSTTSVTVGTPNCSSPYTGDYCFTIGTGLPFVVNAPVQVYNPNNNQQINGTLVAYNSVTGAAVMQATSTSGSGTISTWTFYDYGLWRSDNCSASGGCTSWNNIGTWPNGSMDNIKAITGDPAIWNRAYIGFNGSGYMQYN